MTTIMGLALPGGDEAIEDVVGLAAESQPSAASEKPWSR